MKFRIIYAGMFVSLALLAVAVFSLTQRPASADVIPPETVLPTECSDLIDNDGDGLSDFVPLFGDPDCENIFDNSESGTSGGGGGVPLNQCMDGIDNDEDGDVDLADDGCVNVGDNDESDDGDEGEGGGGSETPTDVCPNIDGDQTEVPSGKVLEGGQCVDAPTSGGGSSNGGSSGGGGSGGGGGGGGSVLGTSASSTACSIYITTFMRMGQENDPEQVKRMQGILKNFEGADVEETGVYDAKSVAAINAFQLKYADEVLTPWGIKTPTGYVFLTTRKKLNEVYCKNATFPLTLDEQQHIELVKSTSVAAPATHASAAPVKPKTVVATTSVTTASEKEESAAPVTGNRISDFFRRLLNRFR